MCLVALNAQLSCWMYDELLIALFCPRVNIEVRLFVLIAPPAELGKSS